MDPFSALIDGLSKKAASATIGPSAPSRRLRPSRPMRRPRDVKRSWPQVPAMLKTTGTIRQVRATEYGYEALVWLNGRHASDELQRNHRTIASVFRVARIETAPHPKHPNDSSQAMIRLVQRDLLEETRPWPGLQTGELSLWDPVELGWDAFGCDVRLELTDRPHVLLAGQTRSGKSVAQSIFVATAALSDARLFLFDANRYQLGRWQAVADEFVVDDMQHAERVLTGLLGELDRRFGLIMNAGVDKLDRVTAVELGLPPILLAIDEGADYLRIKNFTDTLTRLCARGAAAGLRVVFGTQSPNATIIPTPLRNNMQRMAFRVADSSASRVALDTSSVDASEIPFTRQGTCYLDRDGHGLTQMRTYYPTPDQIRELVARAVELRS